MKVALVSPDDLSSVLFCKEIILLLRDHYKADVYVLGDVYDRIGCYAETIRSWGVRFVPIKMERYIDPVKDLKFFESMRRFFGEKRVQAVITNCTKPNIYGPMAAKCAGVGNARSSSRQLTQTHVLHVQIRPSPSTNILHLNLCFLPPIHTLAASLYFACRLFPMGTDTVLQMQNSNGRGQGPPCSHVSPCSRSLS